MFLTARSEEVVHVRTHSRPYVDGATGNAVRGAGTVQRRRASLAQVAAAARFGQLPRRHLRIPVSHLPITQACRQASAAADSASTLLAPARCEQSTTTVRRREFVGPL